MLENDRPSLISAGTNGCCHSCDSDVTVIVAGVKRAAAQVTSGVKFSKFMTINLANRAVTINYDEHVTP